MTTHPAQLLILLLLGLSAAAVLAFAVALLYRARRPRRAAASAVSRGSGTPAPAVLDDDSPERRARRRWMVAAALAMLLAVFAGRFLVRAFHPAGQQTPKVVLGTTDTVPGASGSDLAVARKGGGPGPTLVFTHGWGADRRDWAYAIAALPSRLPVVVWDLPGLGESSPTASGDYSVETLAADLDRVVASQRGRPVILVGHSIGGMLNIEYARRFPDRMGRDVIALVQVNTTFTNPIETKKNAERSRMLQKPVFEPLLHVVEWTSPLARALGWLAYQSGLAHLQLASQSFAGSETWQQLDEMARYAYRSSPRVVARGVLGMLRWDGSDVLPKIAVPTLVISGNEDVTTLPAASERMAREIPGAMRVSIEAAAHLGPVERYARYAGAIAAFADKAAGSARGDPGLKVNVSAPAR